MQQHAQPGDVLASQDVLTLAPDALKLSPDMAKGTLAHNLLLLTSVRPQTRPPTKSAYQPVTAEDGKVYEENKGHFITFFRQTEHL